MIESQIVIGNSVLKQIKIKCIIVQEHHKLPKIDEIEIYISNIISFNQFLHQVLEMYSIKQMYNKQYNFRMPVQLLYQQQIQCFQKETQIDREEKKSLLELGIVDNSLISIRIENQQPSGNSLQQIDQNLMQQLSLADQYTVSFVQQQNQIFKQQLNKQMNQFNDKKQQDIEELERLITISNFNQQSKSNPNNRLNFIINSHKFQMIGNAIDRSISEKFLHNSIVDPRDYKMPQIIDENNLELLLYVLSDQLGQSNIKLYHSKEKDDLSMYSLQTSFAKDCSQAQCLKLKLQETNDLKFDDLSNNQQLGEKFIQDIKEILSKSYKVQNDEVDILSIEKGSIVVHFKVNDVKDDLEASIVTQAEIEKRFPSTKPTVELIPFLKQLLLTPNDFDPKGNMEWNINHKEWEERGPQGDKMKYFFPRGWKGYGLNVINKYDDGNKDWLLMNGNPNQWHIMFHGTGSLGCKGIMKDGFKIGNNQQYKANTCMRTKQKVGEGVYFSNHIEVCQQYSSYKGTQVQDKEYFIVFMSRVKPSAIRQIQKKSDIKEKIGEPDWDNDYFLVNQVEDIRPYRILLQNKQQSAKQKMQSLLYVKNPYKPIKNVSNTLKFDI